MSIRDFKSLTVCNWFTTCQPSILYPKSWTEDGQVSGQKVLVHKWVGQKVSGQKVLHHRTKSIPYFYFITNGNSY